MSSVPNPRPPFQRLLPCFEPGDFDAHGLVVAPEVPTAAELEASRLGYELLMAGEDPAPPQGWDFRRLVAFYGGVYSAWEELADAVDDFESWVRGLPGR